MAPGCPTPKCRRLSPTFSRFYSTLPSVFLPSFPGGRPPRAGRIGRVERGLGSSSSSRPKWLSDLRPVPCLLWTSGIPLKLDVGVNHLESFPAGGGGGEWGEGSHTTKRADLECTVLEYGYMLCTHKITTPVKIRDTCLTLPHFFLAPLQPAPLPSPKGNHSSDFLRPKLM